MCMFCCCSYCLPFQPTDSSLIWEIIIMGPPGSPYEDGDFTFTIVFPDNYPYTAPQVRTVLSLHFTSLLQITLNTTIYHPLVNHDTNEFCAAHITKDWKSTLTLSYIVKELYAMLDVCVLALMPRLILILASRRF